MNPQQVKEVHSYCGGLPAPECSNNPLGFKFFWSPSGAILSQRNSVSFILDNKQVNIDAEDLMATAKSYFMMDDYGFVAHFVVIRPLSKNFTESPR